MVIYIMYYGSYIFVYKTISRNRDTFILQSRFSRAFCVTLAWNPWYSLRSDMKNLGSRWTVPDIARTAAARTLFLVAISSERDSSSSKNNIRNRNKTRSNNDSNRNSVSNIIGNSDTRVTAIDKTRESKRSRSALEVLRGRHLSVRPASSDRIVGTTRPKSTLRNRPVAGSESRRFHHRIRSRQQQQQQQPLNYSYASWDTRTSHFRNC